jgi:MoaA/NifB/PqqE/SkfB family radical SAM enzyme
MSTDISLELLTHYENKIVWNLNQLCNYRCSYCFFPPEVLAREHEAVGKYSIEHISRSFDDTGREWLVMISGGEPFIYKDFVPLMKLLTRKHHIQLTTNLSRPSVYQFADEIDPARVMIVSASFHVTERESRGEWTIKDYIDKYLYLKKRGFLVLANYVTYPPLLPRMRSDFQRLRDAGVDNITTLTFRGEFEGRQYPQAYTEEEKALITELAVDKYLEDAVSHGLYFQGRFCDAGFRYLQMNPDGLLHRCCSILTEHGNLFEGTARFEEGPTPCTVVLCQDACMGVSAVHDAIETVDSL